MEKYLEKMSFSGHIANKFQSPHYSPAEYQKPHCKQDERSLLSCSTVWGTCNSTTGTHCTYSEILVLPSLQLAGPSFSRKHDFVVIVHERLRYTHWNQSSPTSEIEWLCVDVDGCKIVNVCKPSPTLLWSQNLPLFPHPIFHAGNFNCRHVNWGNDNYSPDGECLAG